MEGRAVAPGTGRDPVACPARGRAGAAGLEEADGGASLAVRAVLSVDSGNSVRYYTDATGEARENYYTGAVADGEPPGRWYGTGAAALGLSGQVRTQDMLGLYERFLDPRDDRFRDMSQWDNAPVAGHQGRSYLSEEQVYEAMLAAERSAGLEPDAGRRDEMRVEAGRAARQNNAYHDVTYSVQKSVTVLHAAFEFQEIQARRAGDVDSAAAWGVLRTAVENAIWAGNNAALDYLSEHAGYSRIGHHGGSSGRWTDAHDWTVASFFQHDSQAKDPQLHIHNPIWNRVLCADGKWRTLDGQAIRAFKGAAGAVADRTTEAHLAESLGVLAVMRPDGKARELVGVAQEVCELLSSRRRVIGAKAARLVEAFQDRHGREATPLERDRLARRANLSTRKSKSAVESVETRLDRVQAQVATELGTGLGQVAEAALAASRADRPEAARWSAREVIEVALAAVQEQHSAWTRSQLTREISHALPDYLGITGGRQIARLLDELTDQAIALAVPLDVAKPGDIAVAEQFRLANGDSAFVAPGRARYATPDHLSTERLLIEATTRRDGRATSAEAARGFLDRLAGEGIELGADQAAVITGVLTSGARVESLIGPAGAGKSFVLGVLNRAWSDPATWRPAAPGAPAGRVVGLATSEKAAGVLAAEGITSSNTAAWLAAQLRLAEGRAGERDRELAIGPGDLVVVDESSMADTAAVAAVHARVAQAGASMLMVGDHRQAGAVGAGGISELLAERGRAYELTEVRRFHQPWERAASLRLRAGDPSALDDYHREGRIHDGGTLEAAEIAASRGWLADTLAGKQSVLVVDTNEQAGRLNSALRAELVGLGRVTENGLMLGLEGTTAGVGDVVQARRLAWELAGYEGNKRGPINREQFLVLEVRDDGSLLVAPLDTLDHTALHPATTDPDHGSAGWFSEQLVLPASYVRADLSLGYAATVHAVEGLTVDTGHEVATPRTPANLLYPGATRGREENHLYVVTRNARDDAEPGEVARAVTRNPRAVLAEILETDRAQKAATAVAGESFTEAVSARTAAERLAAVAEVVVAERTTGWFDELTATGELTIAQRRRLAAEDGVAKLAPVLRRVEMAGRDPCTALAAALQGRSLDGAHRISNVLVHRLADGRALEPVGESFASWTPATDDPALAAQLAQISAAGDRRVTELGAELAARESRGEPSWASHVLGELPDAATDPPAHAAWVHRAGVIAAHREVAGLDELPTAWTDRTASHEHVYGELLGPAPHARQVEAHASWRAAWRASGQPDIDRDERRMSDGQLRMRVRAWEREKPWAPRRVDNQLAGTIQAARHHRETEQLRTAAATAATDPGERDRLTREAREAAALAGTLEGQVPELRRLRDVHAAWLAHTAATRAAADRARAELAARDSLNSPAEERVTAAEWEAARRAAEQADEPHREITEHDLAERDLPDHAEQDGEDGVDETGDVQRAKLHVHPAEPDELRDLRALVEHEHNPVDEDTVHVPTAAEAKAAVHQADRAMTEVRARQAADAAREAHETETQTARVIHWHTRDQHTHAEEEVATDGA
ncbi:MAG: MobF family relaxase [Pseudonocardia sp.]